MPVDTPLENGALTKDETKYLLGDTAASTTKKYVYDNTATSNGAQRRFAETRRFNTEARAKEVNKKKFEKNVATQITQLEADVARDFKIAFPNHPQDYIDIPRQGGGTKRFELRGPMKEVAGINFASQHDTAKAAEVRQDIRDIATFMVNQRKTDPEKLLGITQGHHAVFGELLTDNLQLRHKNKDVKLSPMYAGHTSHGTISTYPDGTTRMLSTLTCYGVMNEDNSKMYVKDAKSGKTVELNLSDNFGVLDAAVKNNEEELRHNGIVEGMKVKHNGILEGVKVVVDGKEKTIDVAPMVSFTQAVEYTPGKQEDKIHTEVSLHTKALKNVDTVPLEVDMTPPKKGLWQRFKDFVGGIKDAIMGKAPPPVPAQPQAPKEDTEIFQGLSEGLEERVNSITQELEHHAKEKETDTKDISFAEEEKPLLVKRKAAEEPAPASSKTAEPEKPDSSKSRRNTL